MIARTVLATLLMASAAAAHEAPSGMKYSAFCCNGNGHTGDCAPIPQSSVKPVVGGFQVSVGPGDHPMVTREHTFFVPYDKPLPSTDGAYHMCLFPNEDTLRCFYSPDHGA